MKALILDDNYSAAEAICGYLHDFGHSCDIFTDYQSALCNLSQVSYDVAIIDIALCSEKNGFDFAREVEKKQPCCMRIAITGIDITASCDKIDVFHQVYIKPLKLSAIQDFLTSKDEIEAIMGSECDRHAASLERLESKWSDTQSSINKQFGQIEEIRRALLGDLSAPQDGFINKTNARLANVEKNQGGAFRLMWIAVTGATVSIVGGVVKLLFF